MQFSTLNPFIRNKITDIAYKVFSIKYSMQGGGWRHFVTLVETQRWLIVRICQILEAQTNYREAAIFTGLLAEIIKVHFLKSFIYF